MNDLPLQKWWLELMRTGTPESRLCTASAIRPPSQLPGEGALATSRWGPPEALSKGQGCGIVISLHLHLAATPAFPSAPCVSAQEQERWGQLTRELPCAPPGDAGW